MFNDQQNKSKLITKRRVVILGLVCLILLAAVILIRPRFIQSSKPTLQSKIVNQVAATDNRTAIQTPKASIPINRDFSFKIADNSQTPGKIDFFLDSAELRNQIVVKGETATAIKGRMFLIINLKLKNDQKNPLTVNTRNYIRLSINDNLKEWLAPDIHNDPVEVQAISTKLTRVGFPIADTDSKLKLQVGEIDGEKTTIDLNF